MTSHTFNRAVKNCVRMWITNHSITNRKTNSQPYMHPFFILYHCKTAILSVQKPTNQTKNFWSLLPDKFKQRAIDKSSLLVIWGIHRNIYRFDFLLYTRVRFPKTTRWLSESSENLVVSALFALYKIYALLSQEHLTEVFIKQSQLFKNHLDSLIKRKQKPRMWQHTLHVFTNTLSLTPLSGDLSGAALVCTLHLDLGQKTHMNDSPANHPLKS